MARLKWWLAVVLWASLISSFSTDAFSSEHTSHFLIPLLSWIFPSASPGTLSILHEAIRKSVHLCEYFVFSFLLFRALRAPRKDWVFPVAAIAVVLATLFATSDEFHQSFVASRGASVWDVLLDSCGAIAAQIIMKRVSGPPSDNAQTQKQL